MSQDVVAFDGQLAAVPVNRADVDPRVPEDGVGLCLSGGGYRAMLFHLGTLWRLYDSDHLKTIDRISSVSGGSITSGVLALAWPKLGFNPKRPDDFIEHVVTPLRAMASRTIDQWAVIGGLFTPGAIADKVAGGYRRHLFGKATLQDLPDQPRFVINASNVQTAALWRFSKPFMGDWRVGRILNPTTELAVAVAGSSAFPPILSPLRLPLNPKDFQTNPTADLQREPFTRHVILTDGGVYDNLGLETVWKRYRTVLVSDAGMKISPQASPHIDWIRGSLRVADIVDSQVRALRNRQLMSSFAEPPGSANHRDGAYWSVRSDISALAAPSKLNCPLSQTQELAATPTRLKKMDGALQERLINWGYAACDAAIRTHLFKGDMAPRNFPYKIGV